MIRSAQTLFAGLLVVFLFASLLASAVSASGNDKKQHGAELTGSFTQGGLVFGKAEPGARVFLEGKWVRVSPQGDFVIGFGRNASLKSMLTIRYPSQGKQFTSVIEISPRKYQEQRIDGLPPASVTPSEADLKRIRRDVADIVRARSTDDERTDFLDDFDWPVVGVITGVYGSRRILNGEPRRPHYGVDIHAPTGTPVRAPAAGKVTLAHPDMFFSGATLVLDHGHGISSTFLHLEKILVQPGDIVEKNSQIATVGSSGRSTGPHLDWRVNWFSTRLDPQLLVGNMPAGN